MNRRFDAHLPLIVCSVLSFLALPSPARSENRSFDWLLADAPSKEASPQYKFGSDPLDGIQPEPVDGSSRPVPAQFGKPRGEAEENGAGSGATTTATSDNTGSDNKLSGGSSSQHLTHGKLMGGISHSEVLSPVGSAQAEGKIYNPQAIYHLLRKPGGTARKFAVPNWLAGTWSRNETTEVSRISLPDGHNVKPGGPQTTLVIDRFGTTKDGQGHVWQVFDPAKSSGEIDRGDLVDFHSVFGYRIVIISPMSAAVEVQAAHAVLNKKSKKITSLYQDEELNVFTSLADGHLRTDSSVKVFDMKGKPLFLTRSVSTERRTQAFK